jgi:hypothetical protein
MDLKLAWLALPFLAACASTVEWAKPGATQQAIDADVRACRVAADQVPTLPRPQTAPPTTGAGSPTGTDLDADRQLQQAQRVEVCMRERGYQLVRK